MSVFACENAILQEIDGSNERLAKPVFHSQGLHDLHLIDRHIAELNGHFIQLGQSLGTELEQ